MDPAPALVLDTNVVLAWLVFRDPQVAPALDAVAAAGRLRWLASAAMHDEFAEVLRRGLAARTGTPLQRALDEWQRHATPVAAAASQPRWRCRDGDDQKFIDLAVEQRARWLLTRDRDLLALARRLREHGIAIATPAAWLAAGGG